jgi:hypothetical protein
MSGFTRRTWRDCQRAWGCKEIELHTVHGRSILKCCLARAEYEKPFKELRMNSSKHHKVYTELSESSIQHSIIAKKNFISG